MTILSAAEAPRPHKLLKATIVSALVAGVLLVTVVLPAEYGIDPTGIGSTLGLTALAAIDEPSGATPAPNAAPSSTAGNAAEAQKATVAFGANPKQSFSAESLSVSAAVEAPKRESLTVTLAPGKGTEVKTLLAQGDGLVYRWSADAEVAVDMHGERPGVKGPWTSYSVEAAQRSSAGTFVAPFEGSHGWYWENRGNTPVTVQIEVSGFQSALYQP